MSEHQRLYEIAGITVKVECDLPLTDETFEPKFAAFRREQAGDDVITVRHHFGLPDLSGRDLGRQVYRQPPWAIYSDGEAWTYLGIATGPNDPTIHRVAVSNRGHTVMDVYHPDQRHFIEGNWCALTSFATDQILLGRVLADRGGFYLHSSGLIMDGQGLLFVGHSDAGKSTTVKLLNGRAEVLCDDRNIVRRRPEGWWLHGTWSHGEIPLVSAESAPLRAVFLLRKSAENRLTRVCDAREALNVLLGCVIKPLADRDWWDKVLPLVETFFREVPCYHMDFDRSGAIVGELERLIASE